MLDAELKVRAEEASGAREEEHAAQRNKGRRAMEFPDEVESEQRHDRRGSIATVQHRVSPRGPAHSDHPCTTPCRKQARRLSDRI